jgi:hypothetical protein
VAVGVGINGWLTVVGASCDAETKPATDWFCCFADSSC